MEEYQNDDSLKAAYQLREIGKRVKASADRNFRLSIFFTAGTSVLILTSLFLLWYFGHYSLIAIVFFAILFILLDIPTFFRYKKVRDTIKTGNDEEIGRQYALQDPHVKGYHANRKKILLSASLSLGCAIALMGGVIFGMSYASQPTDFSTLSEKTGILSQATYSTDEVSLTFTDDKETYRIESLYLKALDWNEFKAKADKTQSFTIRYENKDHSGSMNTYFLEQNGYAFLSEDEVHAAEAEDKKNGTILGIVFLAVSLPLFASIPFTLAWTKKGEKSETIDLSLLLNGNPGNTPSVSSEGAVPGAA
jgi:hypothetical protein